MLNSNAGNKGTDAIWLVSLLAAACVLRLYQLGDTPFHHDESIHAYLSYQLWQGGPYRYNPVFHGPFLYWSNALIYQFFGATDFTARLMPALFSIVMLLPIWSLREYLGSVGWKVAALFMVFSPSLGYYGRFLAHDNYCALFSLLLVVLAMGYFQRPAAWRIAAIGLITGLFLATKAVSFIFLGTVAAFALLVFALDTFAPQFDRRHLWRQLLHWLRDCWRHWSAGLAAMLLAYLALYSSFFSHPQGVWDGVFGTLSYWGGQHAEPRIPGPLYYYLPRLLLHEPVFLLAIPATIWAARYRYSPLDVFLAFWTVAALSIYGYAQEKVPWLLMHMLLPMLLLAGRWVDQVWHSGFSRLAAATTLALLLGWSLRDTLWLSFRMPPASAHLLTYMASTAEMKEAARRIRDLSAAPGQVVLAGVATWPMTWYLRDTKITVGLGDGWEDTAILVEAGADDKERLEAAGFTGREYALMTWWYPNLRQLLGSGLPDYLWRHRSAEPPGEYRFTLFQPAADGALMDHPDE